MKDNEENFYDKLLNKEFRDELISNPKDCIKNLVDEDLHDIKYKVVESTKNITYIAIPNNSEVINLSALGGISAAGYRGNDPFSYSFHQFHK